MSSVSSSYFLNEYNHIPDMSAIEILMSFGIIKSYNGLSVSSYSTVDKEISEDILSLPNDDSNISELIPFELFSEQTIGNRRRSNEDFVSKSEILDKRLAKSAIKDNFVLARDKASEIHGHTFVITGYDTSYRILVDRSNIPHLLGLPSINTIYNSLDTRLTNYLKDNNVNGRNYLEFITRFLTDDRLKEEWFFDLFKDITLDDSTGNKDNTDKIGYKRACMQTLIESLIIGNSKYTLGSNKLITYKHNKTSSSDKDRIMSIINIPNTDGYIGLICIYNEEYNYYSLCSLVAFNESDLRNFMALEGTSFDRIGTEINTNITEIELCGLINYQNSQLKKREDNKTREVVYKSDDRYSDLSFSQGLHEEKKKIINAHSKSSRIFCKKVLDILNQGYDSLKFKKILPKYLINLILTSKLKYEDFIYNILIILKNTRSKNKDIYDILNKFYSMSYNDFNLLTSQDNGNNYEINLGVIDNFLVSLDTSFVATIGCYCKKYDFNLKCDDVNLIKQKFNEHISRLYNDIIYSDDLSLSVHEVDDKMDYSEFINYAKIIKNLIEYQRFVNASLEQINIIKSKKRK